MKSNLIEGTISEEGNGWYGTDVGDTVYCSDTGLYYEIIERSDYIHTQQWQSNWIHVKVKHSDYDNDSPESCASLKIDAPSDDNYSDGTG